MPPAKDGSDFKELDLKTTLVDTWKAMIALQKTGKVKSIGVSNFTPKYLRTVLEGATIVPAVNQVRDIPSQPKNSELDASRRRSSTTHTS